MAKSLARKDMKGQNKTDVKSAKDFATVAGKHMVKTHWTDISWSYISEFVSNEGPWAKTVPIPGIRNAYEILYDYKSGVVKLYSIHGVLHKSDAFLTKCLKPWKSSLIDDLKLKFPIRERSCETHVSGYLSFVTILFQI